MIKMISGAYPLRGDYGEVEMKTSASKPFSLDEASEARLVKRGVASYVPRRIDPEAESTIPGVATPQGGRPEDGAGVTPLQNEGGAEGTTDDSIPEYSIDTGMEKLKELYELCGFTFRVGMSKAKMIAEMDDYFATAGDDETPPELDPEEPVS